MQIDQAAEEGIAEVQPPSPAGIEFSAHAWVCKHCCRECIPIRSESRCICGHRLKQHTSLTESPPARCKHGGCTCTTFFYIVAEGSWVLRCRCKHKHTEHDPVTHACAKSGCQCAKFYSPWICNCNHPWSEHQQVVRKRKVWTGQSLLDKAAAPMQREGIAEEVNRWDLLREAIYERDKSEPDKKSRC